MEQPITIGIDLAKNVFQLLSMLVGNSPKVGVGPSGRTFEAE